MSQYLIRRIEEMPNITLHVRTEITALEGQDQLGRVTWKTVGKEAQTHDIGHVFLMMGALPCTAWLNSCIALNDKGFVRTGADLRGVDLSPGDWPNARRPHYFESSVPGIFAVGDVRCGSVKRVAAAVGEGSACIQQVHRVLGEGSEVSAS
jgi:thioredoxin reductase (NADPH)